MVVTLDVSKLSGWLNADAICRVEKRTFSVCGDVQPGRRGGVGWRRHASGMCTERPPLVTLAIVALAELSLGVHVLAHVPGTRRQTVAARIHMGLCSQAWGCMHSHTHLCLLGLPVLGAACSQPLCTSFMSVRPYAGG